MNENFDIICIGEGLVELSAQDSLTYAQSFNKYYGGDALCAAVAAARLGSRVGFISRIGNDYFKDFLLESMQMDGLDTSHIKIVEGVNGVYFVARPNDNDKTKEFAYYRKKTAVLNLSVDDIAFDYLEKTRILYSSGMIQSLSPSYDEALRESFKFAKENGILTAYDPNYSSSTVDLNGARDYFDSIVEYVDILLLNAEHDAQSLIELPAPEKIIRYMNDRGVSVVVVRNGKEGYTVGYNGEIKHFPSIITNPVDTTNNGDAFNGGFLHGIASGYPPFEAAQLAAVVAKYQAKQIGAIKSLPYKDEIYSEFRNKI